MLKYIPLCGLILALAASEAPVNGIKSSNVLGGAEQHASFSFVRPGLTQTSFAFNGPSSHQQFSSSIGNPLLAQKVLPNVAHALAYRNPGLGYFSTVPIATPSVYLGGISAASQPSPYQFLQDPALLTYLQQTQQFPQFPAQVQAQVDPNNIYQAYLLRLLALRQQAQAQTQAQSHQVPKQIQLQQQEQQSQNLLGVAYSAAPSVAHVKVSGNGYKFDF